MKKFVKISSILLTMLFGIFNFVACSSNNDKQAYQILTTENISDIGTNADDNISDEITNISKDETSNEIIEITNSYPITSGFYKFNKETLTFNDIYYKDETELLSFFETKDLNGVYDIVVKNGFNDFAKSLTSFTSGETTYKKIVNFNKNESAEKELNFSIFYESAKNVFTDCNSKIIYSVEDGNIVFQENKPEFIINKETNQVSILYPFYYVDKDTAETIYTKLYIKADLTLYHAIDIMQDESLSNAYTYVELSAQIKAIDGFVNETEALKSIETMFELAFDNVDFIAILQNIELYFDTNNELYVCYTEDIINIAEKTDISNNYTIFEALNINLVNEYYDVTLETKILTINITIDENTYFEFKFVS